MSDQSAVVAVLESKRAELLSLFTYEHLPPHLQDVSRPICRMAHHIAETTRPCWDQIRALEHLMIAKDAAVRSAVAQAIE